jgi:PAS domain S-box-containing protein
MELKNQSIRILFVEDLPDDVEMAHREIKKGKIDFTYKVTDTEPEFRELLNTFNPDVVVSDYSMPSFDGMTALKISLETKPNTPFIVLTGSMNEETAVACMKAGATDYVIKEQIKRLPFAVKDAINKSQAWQEKEMMQQQLQESEGMYRTLIENSKEAIYLMFKRKFEIINPEFQKMFGYTLDDLQDENFDPIKLIAPESLSLINERISKLDEGKDVTSRYEFTALTKNGQKKEVKASVSYIRFRDGIATQGIVHDITERKRAVEKLKYNSALTQMLMELSYNFINLPLSEVNDAINDSLARMGEFVDADRSYIFEYDFENRITSNTFEWCREGIDSQIDLLQNVPMEFVPDWIKRHEKGEIIFIKNVSDLEDKTMRDMLEPQGIKSVLTIPLLKENNQCIGFVGFDFVRKNYSYTNSEEQLLKVFAQMLLNVEQRKQLETNRVKLAKAIEESPVSIIITDKNGNIEYVNPKTLEISGYNKKELLGKNMRIFKSGFHDNNFYASLWNSILGGNNWYGEMVNRKKNGTNYWIDVSISPLFDDEGKIAHFVSIREDITEKKKMIEELVLAKEKAEESDRLKSAFLANMSHEIRTPMNGILGFTDLLKEPRLSGEEKNQYVDVIQKSGERMLNTINDLIEISKIESGTMKIDWSNVNINETIDFFYTFFKPEVSKKGLDFTSQKTLPYEKATIKTDKEKLNAIITNLIKNAVKYTSSGYIKFGYNVKKLGVEFYVKDTGIGIEKGRLKAVFDRFVQADNSYSKPYEGAGLGLAISKAYAEMLGGEIWVISEPGKGSEFLFHIPHYQ